MQKMFFFQAEDGIRDVAVTGVQTCALPILLPRLASVERRSGDDVLEGSLDPGRDDVVGIDWVHGDRGLLSLVHGPSSTSKSVVARPNGVGSGQLDKRADRCGRRERTSRRGGRCVRV